MSSTTPPPALWSVRRLGALAVALVVAISSGTNYVYSAYAPQLGSRLHINHTKLNIIGLAGNVGVYSTAPFWGHIVDVRGPRPLFIMGFCMLLAGYSGIRYIYDAGVPYDDPKVSLSTLQVCLLVIFGYMTGAGGNGGLASSVNAAAKSFPDRARATTTGIVLSGFGLSAFVFSTIAHTAFPGNTSSFLLVLALGTSVPMIAGFFFVHPIPLPTSELTRTLERGFPDHHIPPPIDVEARPFFQGSNNSQTPLLSSGFEADEHPAVHRDREHTVSEASAYAVPHSPDAVELSPTRSISPGSTTTRHRSRSSVARRSLGNAARMIVTLPNIHGKQMWATKEFWTMFSIITLLSGTGLMWINNVGSISQALFAQGNRDYDEAESAIWQAAQVSTVSFTNFAGRISIGILSDYCKNKLQFPRSYLICLVAFMFIVSQVTAANVDDVRNLWKASAMLGLAYGSMFGLFPMVTIDWFGLAHFSENWGTLSLSPLLGGNLFSIAFGWNLDAHAEPESAPAAMARRGGLPSAHQCFEGRQCYVTSLYMTISVCFVALLMSVWAAWMDRQKAAALKAGDEVLWEDDED